MSYDTVDFSDKAHFRTPSDEHSSDEPRKNGAWAGNGICNVYTIELEPKPYGSDIQVRSCKCKNTNRVKIIMAGTVVVFHLAFLIIISAIAHNEQHQAKKGSQEYYIAHHKQQQATKESKNYGLLAYGPDKNELISFSPNDHMSYKDYFNRLESSLANYSTLRQVSNLDKFVLCNDNTTKVPEGKVCMLTLEKFGDNCQNYGMYGINEERPCVLLVLKVEDSITLKPFDFSKDENADIKKKIGDRYSAKSIAITCEGKTEQDQALLARTNYTDMVSYNPPKGFPLYYFLQRETDDYLSPAVMVQFNTIPLNSKVNIVCTAWAKSFNNGLPEDSKKYSTEFAILLK